VSRYTRSKKGRARSHYKERLEARGLTKAPKMPDIKALRKRADRAQDHPDGGLPVIPRDLDDEESELSPDFLESG
jgi:hypothetical protein